MPTFAAKHSLKEIPMPTSSAKHSLKEIPRALAPRSTTRINSGLVHVSDAQNAKVTAPHLDRGFVRQQLHRAAKSRAVHFALLGSFIYSGLFVFAMMFGLALEERYAQGWALLQYSDQIPWWELALHPVLVHVLLFPFGLLVDAVLGPGLLSMGCVPIHGALLGWWLGRRKGR